MSRSPDDISIFINARMESRRCPGKMLRNFSGRTLVDICLEKAEHFSDVVNEVWFAAHEPELLVRAERFNGLKIHRRSSGSAASDSDPRLIFEVLHRIETKYVMWFNPCTPLVSIETCEAAIKYFVQNPKVTSLTSVKRMHGWFYSPDGVLLNKVGEGIDTAKSVPVLAVAHGFHLYDRERFLRTWRLWPNKPLDPYLFEIPESEAYDIDSEEELLCAEQMYRLRHGTGPDGRTPWLY